ncbi:hypothetical protein HNR46_003991 [Haloferula luteola]|uniref:Uncharacterized protein n=1 Tax=Haloferula luteola TaxID=595692 RepID=A0A840VIQ0_9BACT|nr:hypothetical protein [Haloferula luteola]
MWRPLKDLRMSQGSSARKTFSAPLARLSTTGLPSVRGGGGRRR